MKHIILSCLLVCVLQLSAQSLPPGTILISYDDAGNRVLRQGVPFQNNNNNRTTNPSKGQTQTETLVLQQIVAYPNPTKGLVNIELNHVIEGLNFQILDITGKSIHKGSFSGKNLSINLSNYVEGVYFIELLDSKNTIIATHKLIKE